MEEFVLQGNAEESQNGDPQVPSRRIQMLSAGSNLCKAGSRENCHAMITLSGVPLPCPSHAATRLTPFIPLACSAVVSLT